MIPFPKKKYNIIYADPPWYFKSYSKKGEQRNATKHYPCMEFNDLCNLDINSIAAVDCVLFMWVVDPLLHKSFELLKAWDFKFKTTDILIMGRESNLRVILLEWDIGLDPTQRCVC